ncbi:hypothetical protein GHO41_26820 [Pseudomonas sp. FSL R10-0399]|nr:TglA family RiPP precursor [Pseudomonas sp. FSL R10-0399]MQT60949.1 hypothetical protein [Pseudomonas sp. FSL R10-0399]
MNQSVVTLDTAETVEHTVDLIDLPDPISTTFEGFDLDDIEIIESKVFA